MTNIVFLNTKSRICKRLPMSKKVKGETNIIFVDGHYVPYGEVYCEDVKDHYVHYGHYKSLKTAKAIVTLDLISKGGKCQDLTLELTEELQETLGYNRDLKRLLDLAVKEMFFQSLYFFDNEDEETIRDIISGTLELEIMEDDIPF